MSISERALFSRAGTVSLLALILLLLSAPVLADNDGSLLKALRGDPEPGALLIGRTEPGASVWLGDQQLRVDDEGYFAFGFGRDEEGEARLRLELDEHEDEIRLTLAEREWDIQHIEGVPPETVTPPEEELDRIFREQEKVASARKRDSGHTHFRGDFQWPVTGRITGVYGSQRVFDGEPRRPHYGVDIAAPEGTPVKAPSGGEVAMVHEDMFFSGGTLVIDHGYGVSTSYLHLSEILVEEGEQVEQGQEVARVGATGRATGPHLCWRVNWYEKPLDPKTLVGEMPGD